MAQYIVDFRKINGTGGPYVYDVVRNNVGERAASGVTAGNLLDAIQADIQALSPGETIGGGRLVVNTTP